MIQWIRDRGAWVLELWIRGSLGERGSGDKETQYRPGWLEDQGRARLERGRGGFEDAGILWLELPPGYTFSSSSGVLLTQPLPEPAAALQLLVGVAAIGIAHGGRRRGRPHAHSG
ncbi:MAG: hypothetical protein CL908_13950 [Deltaproteobacteria bacterium]|nr:hypothetical protein [Deltaproteobacteria bacterium]